MTTFNQLPPTSSKAKVRILGIDPGYDRLGIAVIEKSQAGETFLYSECFTPPKGELETRLKHVWEKLGSIMHEYTPDLIGVESIFAENNVTTVIGIAQVLGIIRAQSYGQNIAVHTFTPLQIKAAITGNGRAIKADMDKMTRLLISIPKKKMLDDEMDAIAVALTTSAYIKNSQVVE